jgi:hypothetical protein
MSLNVYLEYEIKDELKIDGHEPVYPGYSANITHNLNKMADEAGAPPPALRGLTTAVRNVPVHLFI